MADYSANEVINLILQFPNNMTVNFRALLATSVSQLKLSIEQARIVPESQYYFTLNGILLHNDWILGEVGVVNGAQLVVNPRKQINASIMQGENEIKLTTTEHALISDLKTSLAYEFYLDEDNITLIFNEEECENDKAIFDLGINDGSVIYAIEKDEIKFVVRYLSDNFNCTISPSSKIKELKEVLSEFINSGLDLIRLYYNRRELNNNMTVEECNIVDNSIIHAF